MAFKQKKESAIDEILREVPEDTIHTVKPYEGLHAQLMFVNLNNRRGLRIRVSSTSLGKLVSP